MKRGEAWQEQKRVPSSTIKETFSELGKLGVKKCWGGWTAKGGNQRGGRV